MPIPTACMHGVSFEALEGCPACLAIYDRIRAERAARSPVTRPACHVEVHTCPACMGKGHIAVVEGR